MSLVPSLLQAIVRVDGEALVMHVGEKPYVISPSGQVDLAAKGVTLEAVTGIVGQLLSADALKALDDLGAVQYELAPLTAFPGERFTVTAARGGDDIWAEIRRRHVVEEVKAAAATAQITATGPDEASDALALPREDQLWPAPVSAVELEEPPVAPEPMFEALTPALELPLAAAPPIVVPPQPEPVASTLVESSIEIRAIAAPAVPEEPAEEPELTPVVDVAPWAPPAWAAEPAVSEARDVREVRDTREAHEEKPHVTEPVTPAPAADTERVLEWTFEPAPSAALDSDMLWATGLDSAPEPGADEDLSSLEFAADLLLSSGGGRPAPWAASAAATIESERADTASGRPAEAAIAPERTSPRPSSRSEAFPLTPVRPAVESVASDRPRPTGPDEASAQAASIEPAGRVPQPAVDLPSLGAAAPFIFDREPTLERAPLSAGFERPADFSKQMPSPMSSPSSALASGPSFVPAVPVTPAAYSAVVLPIDRGAGRSEPALSPSDSAAALERMLRTALSRGASAFYLSSNAKPAARIDGDVQSLEALGVLGPGEVEAALLAVLPERYQVALRLGQPSEWLWELPDLGRVRCSVFNDHRGPGAVFRVVATRPRSADDLGLSRDVQSLSAEAEGLILVSGARASGKSTLLASLVDAINRSRRDYVISFEREVNIVHERNSAFVSQREVRGSTDDLAVAARAALREDPDVLVFEDLVSASVMDVAIEAVQAGRLVLAGVRAPHLSAAVDRVVELYGSERRRQVLASLSQCLRAVVSQVLVKKAAGGRVAAREVLLNSPIVASVLAEGKTSQLGVAIEGGRRQGMVPLNDALAALVLNQTVDLREAYRHATDRAGLVDLLRRSGIDTSLVEKLA